MAESTASRHSDTRTDGLTTLILWTVFLVLLWTAACAAPLTFWNPARLAAAYALAAGQQIYPDPDSGAQLGWFYGPVFPVWLLPVTLIKSPGWAIAAAIVYNGLGLCAAIAWVFHSGGITGRRLLMATALAGVLLFAGGAMPQSWLVYVHVDAPCLIFSLLAIGGVCRFDASGERRWVHIAALAAVTACWTKQSAVILPFAIAAGWLWHRQWSALGPWLLWLGVYAAGVTAVLLCFFPPANLFFYTVTSHANNPLKPDWTFYHSVLYPLLSDISPWIALLLLSLFWQWRRPAAGPWDSRPTGAPARLSRWLWWLAVWQLPSVILATMKMGGGLNSAHAFMCVVLAVACGVIRQPPAPSYRLIGAIFLGGLALVAAGERLKHWQPDPYQDDLLEVAQRHPHQIYFPSNPLITLLTDRTIYPFDDAIGCMSNIKHPVPASRLRAALPPDPLIVYESIAASRDNARNFPGLKTVLLRDIMNERALPRP